MAKFLIRDFDDAKGYREENHPSGSLPRRKNPDTSIGYVPWGQTADKRIVYARTGEHTGWRGGSGPHQLTQYDSRVSQERRRLCQSELGMAVLNTPVFTRKAVKLVSFAMLNELKRDRAKMEDLLFGKIGHYFYTDGRTGFGRISQQSKGHVGKAGVYDGILLALTKGRLDQQMAIHDAIGRKLIDDIGGEKKVKYDELGPLVRQDWFDDPEKRGRAKADARAVANTTGGISGSDNPVDASTAIERSRGVDMFKRDTGRTRDTDADAYYDDVDARNLLFGAGISGTTGTLLQAGIAFGKLKSGEDLMQYTLAIVGYLVGGGMHSYHETMAVASKLGVPYKPGKYVDSLPTAMKASGFYSDWRAKYYDIVELGALHWRHNQSCLPSHLNAALSG